MNTRSIWKHTPHFLEAQLKQALKYMGIVLVLVVGVPQAMGQAGDWGLRKSKRGIEVYTRPAPGSPLDECKGVTTTHASVDELIKALREVENYLAWIPDSEKAIPMENGDRTHVYYLEMKAPFPINHRDGYYRYTYFSHQRGACVELEAIPDYRPEVENMVRIPYTRGYWLFETLDSGQTRITYQVHADPGGSIPTWLANAVVVDHPFDTLESLKEYLE